MIPNNELLFVERSGGYGTILVADRILYDEQSEYQRITVFENSVVGRALALDNMFNVSTHMEAFYHEPMAHLPLALNRGARRVLIIGGGDFGVASHVLKHPRIEEVTMCELDGLVLDVARTYFPEWARAESDPRFELVIGDGTAFVQQAAENRFDVAVIDSTDVYEPAQALMQPQFYAALRRALAPEGILIQLGVDMSYYRDAWKALVPNLARSFTHWKPVFVPIPFYFTGPWGLILASRTEASLDPGRIEQSFFDSIPNLQTLTATRVRGWFDLPPVYARFFESLR